MTQRPILLFEKMNTIREMGSIVNVPDTLVNSLNPKMVLREYQKIAFENFITYFENDRLVKKPTHVLFHMATGSGKTLIMAGLIAYLYKKGYRDFLFFVNSTNIITKTKDNFLNKASQKYLFNDEIVIDGESVVIKEVANFQGSSNDSINICFTTIQGLHMDLWNTKENSLTFEDFEDRKIVLISDEAHHINVETRSARLSSEEENEKQNWEKSVSKILRSDRDNIMLEFTATIDYKNDSNILEKYQDKIIIDYPLSKFRIDGYSKEVQTLRSDSDIIDRSIMAFLLSQYRLKLFEDNGITIKPVILFKSKTIAESAQNREIILNGLKNITIERVERLSKIATEEVLIKMFKYFEHRGIDFNILCNELKAEFDENRWISVNDDKDAQNYQIIVNSLENRDNPYRVIFEVKKLDEGWDVLNLFDIVRLYETRDSKDNKPGKTTIQEAQLIGRGARYCPFSIDNYDEKFKRKFDNDSDHPLKTCEELYYHCQEDSRYINELRNALIELGILATNVVELEYKIKPEMKNSKFYTESLVFFNQKVEQSKVGIVGIPSRIKGQLFQYRQRTGNTLVDTIFEDKKLHTAGSESKIRSMKISEIAKISYSIIHKVIRSYNVFKFDRLKEYFPNLVSIREFITSDEYLGNISIQITYSNDQIDNELMYDSCNYALGIVANGILDIEQTYIGSETFSSKKISEIFVNKKIKISDPSGDGVGIPQSSPLVHSRFRIDLSNEDWFIYNDNFGTTEEKAFVKYFASKVPEFKEKYENVYLVRNERNLPIYYFKDGSRFEPDYLLFLQNSKQDGIEQLQIFIEPKGSHLIEMDKWKEDFLLDLKDKSKAVKFYVDDSDYRIWGFHFFNETDRLDEIENDIISAIGHSF